VLPWGLLLTGSTTVFFLLRSRESVGDAWAWNSPAGHFWIVSAASIVCAFLALAVGIAASRTSNARVLIIALSFLVMAGVFSIHGLATPGFLLEAANRGPAPAVTDYTGTVAAGDGTAASGGYASYESPYDNQYAASSALAAASTGPAEPATPDPPVTVPKTPFYNVTGFSSRLAVALCSGFLALGAAPWPARFERAVVRHRLALLLSVVGLVVAYAVLGLRAPWLVPTWLTGNPAFGWGTLALVTALGAFAAFRFLRAYIRSGLEMHGAVAIGAILLVQAQFSMHFGQTWSGTFWLYHLQLLSGFAAIFWGVVVEFASGRAVRSLETLIVSDVIDQLRSGYAEPVVALSAALEARDGYTLGHGERVAALAVLIAGRMGISGRRLRGIAAGSVLHDVGKIGVPDAVLHKQGDLSHDEYQIIKEHPARGADMLRGQFDQRVEAEVIRHHHERWDGSGYPDRLAGTDIPLAARIAAVADVYDALRSNRAYRPAWKREHAIAMIEEGVGTHFDPRCVEAFRQVVEQWEARYAADHVEYAERRAA